LNLQLCNVPFEVSTEQRQNCRRQAAQPETANIFVSRSRQVAKVLSCCPCSASAMYSLAQFVYSNNA